MILSDKYIVKEDTMNISLYEKYQSKVKVDGKETGEVVDKEKFVAYFSATNQGRSQCYSRMINCEIEEASTLQEVLDTVKRCEEQVVDFWEKQ